MKFIFVANLLIFFSTMVLLQENAFGKNIEVLLKKFDERDQVKLLSELQLKLSPYTGNGFLDNSYTTDADGVWYGRFTKNFGGEVFEVGVEVVAPALNKNFSKPFNEMAVIVNYLQGGRWATAVHMEVVSPVLYFKNKLQGIGNFHRPRKSANSYDFYDEYYGWIFFDLPWLEGNRDFAYIIEVQCKEAGECKVVDDNTVNIRWSKYANLEQLHAEIRRPNERTIRKEVVPYQVDPFFNGKLKSVSEDEGLNLERGGNKLDQSNIPKKMKPSLKDLSKD